MKRFTIKNLMLATVLLVSLASCKKSFLELNPPTSLTPEAALATEADLQVALRGTYAGLKSTALYGRSLMVIGDMMGDNTYQSTLNTNRYTLFNNNTYTVTDGDVAGLWNASYSVILRANNIINSTVAANANVNQYKGEAYAIRALAYYNLVRFFGTPYTQDPTALGVPLVTTYNADLKPGRAKVSEVYALINADLTQAYTLMTKFTNSSQFSKYAAKALQAKVYNTMGDKTNAKTAALDVITNSGFTAVTAAAHAGYWAGVSYRTDKVETLFELSFDAVANNAFDALAYIYLQSGNYGDMLCSDDLYATFAANDARKALYATGTRGGLASVFVNKYSSFSGDHSDTKVIRMSEMYLIAAEASYPANEADAIRYVNEVTSRRGATAIASTGAALLEDIITERRKELAFEGERYHDLQRLKRDVVRGTNYPAAARTIAFSNFRRIMPIPQGELDANPTIKTQQNPGWN
ncbi:MAG: RagB/SusD family nutrient uptake outer membrane protein [Sediminibacterium sp.]|nr:RagB/SusD family nutrient uptake outer membrane protein [Sediminibacterium sp.]MBP6144659.1 RagB/SusD family nutrient uptake outer membrane protein [Sediminibacterium sp.]